MTSLALGSKLSSINARTRVAKAVANFLTGLPQKLVRTTRAGLATCIGPDGTLQWGPHNLISESDSLITWPSFTSQYFTPFAAAAFDGRQYAGRVNTVAGTLTLSKGGIIAADTKVSLSIDVQRGNFDTGNNCNTYGFYNGSSVADLAYVTVNYATGAVALTGPQAGTSVAYTKSLGDGWYRIGITITSGISPGQALYAYLGCVGGTVPAGLNWNVARVMVNNGTSMEYVDSTVKNRLGYTNDFANAYWTKIAMGVYEKTCTGPSGQPATTLVAGSANAEIYQSLSLAGVYTSGLLIRRRSGTGAVSIRNSANSAWLPLTLTNDWQYFANDSGTSGGLALCDLLIATYTDSIDICDAQLNPGTTLWPYSYNPGAAPAVGPLYGQRTDYDPITLACKGALIEAQATQLLANPDNIGAAPWSGVCAVTDDGTKFRGRPMWKLTKTSAAGSEDRYQQFASAVTGNFSTRIAVLASANTATADVVLYDSVTGFGASGDGVAVIESGPGSIAQVSGNGSWWRLTGLSTNVPTVIRAARNFTATSSPTLRIYPDTAASTTIGRFVYFQVDNVVAGSDGGGSFIPNPASSGTVVRVADTSSVGYDDLAKALPWLMDTNTLSYPESLDNAAWLKTRATITPDAAIAPDGTMTADKLVGVNGQAGGYFYRSNVPVTSGAPNTQTIFLKAGEVTNVVLHSSMTGSYKDATLNLVTGAVTFNTFVTPPTMTPRPNGWWRMTLTEQASVAAANILYIDIGAEVGDGVKGFYAWGGTCAPGPIAQTYYPQASKQGTILFEGDLTYGAASGIVAPFSLVNSGGDIVQLFKPASANTLFGYANPSSMGSIATIASGSVFKAAIGFSPPNASSVANGGAESTTASASVMPTGASAINRLLLGTNAANNAASSMHLRRLRIFNTNLPASTKQSITR